MKPLPVLSCLCFIGAPKVSGMSKKVMDLVAYWAGVYDNTLQTKQPGDTHDLVQVRLVPVDIDCFRQNPVIFVEEASNGVIRDFDLVEVTDGIEDTVSLAFYTFANQSNYKPREFNAESLSNMSCGAFHRVQNCTASYKVANGYAYGNYPECKYAVGGKHPRYTTMHRCDSVTATLPQNTGQTSPIEPYEFLYSEKLQVINPPKGYVAPCGSKLDSSTNVTNHYASSARR
ncbi:hypothetical protein BsWGS_23126 [Bradybaena similaris]